MSKDYPLHTNAEPLYRPVTEEDYRRLKQENEELKEANHELQVDLEGAKATAYADSVDAGMRERRLRRALYKAIANWAHDECAISPNAYAWLQVERKCRAKAEQFKEEG